MPCDGLGGQAVDDLTGQTMGDAPRGAACPCAPHDDAGGTDQPEKDHPAEDEGDRQIEPGMGGAVADQFMADFKRRLQEFDGAEV